jgi:hypothetical protein
MAKITKLLANTNTGKLIISATSTGKTVDDNNNVLHHKFTKIYVDVTDTFNCNNEPSSLATVKTLNIDFDTDFTNYEIDLNDLLCSDPTSDLFFVWIEEYEYKESVLRNGFYTDDSINNVEMVYSTDGTNYYKATLTDGEIVDDRFTVITQSEYTLAQANADDDYVVQLCTDSDDNIYLIVTDSEGNSKYYVGDVTNEYLVEELTYQEYLDTTCTESSFNYIFGVTLSVRDFYESILKRIEVKDTNCCNADCSDVNFMLAWSGFNLARALQQYRQMIYYWKLLHNSKVSDSNCGCNG